MDGSQLDKDLKVTSKNLLDLLVKDSFVKDHYSQAGMDRGEQPLATLLESIANSESWTLEGLKSLRGDVETIEVNPN